MCDARLKDAPWGLKHPALGSTAIAILLITSGAAALAAPPTPPAAGSLPGGFTTNESGVTYGVSGSTGTINIPTVSGSNTVLQWGGTSLSTTVPSPGSPATNTGFSIGSGASLAISNGKAASSSVLVNDLTGSPSQIFGALDASGVGGPLYIANASGIIVGNTGNITAPTAGIGIIGYQVSSSAFNGTVSVNAANTPGGPVTVQQGATIKSQKIFVAGAGSVNVTLSQNSCSSGCDLAVYSGSSFTTSPGNVIPPLPVIIPKPPHKPFR